MRLPGARDRWSLLRAHSAPPSSGVAIVVEGPIEPGAGAVAPTDRRRIQRGVGAMALYALAFGTSFGAVSVAADFSLAQTLVLSAVMFTGASQFAFVGVVASGGAPVSAVLAALLLGMRNAFYGVPMSRILQVSGWRRLVASQLVIDESAAVSTAEVDPAAQRHAFWVAGLAMFVCWVTGTTMGAIVGAAIDPEAFGLDAAVPAVLLALLWPSLRTRRGRLVAAGGAVVALVLVPLVSPGIPVVAAVLVPLVVGAVAPRDAVADVAGTGSDGPGAAA